MPLYEDRSLDLLISSPKFSPMTICELIYAFIVFAVCCEINLQSKYYVCVLDRRICQATSCDHSFVGRYGIGVQMVDMNE